MKKIKIGESHAYVAFILLAQFVPIALIFLLSSDKMYAQKMEREWGDHVYSMNMLPVNAPARILAELQKQINVPILGVDYDKKLRPVKVYLINGQIVNIVNPEG